MGKLSGNAETVKGPGFDTTVGKMNDMGYSAADIAKLNPQLNPLQRVFKGTTNALSGGLQGYQQDQAQADPFQQKNMFFGGY